MAEWKPEHGKQVWKGNGKKPLEWESRSMESKVEKRNYAKSGKPGIGEASLEMELQGKCYKLSGKFELGNWHGKEMW